MSVNASTVSATAIGEGPDVVLLHSLLTDRDVWQRIAPTLAEQRRVWLVDLPGYGGSAPAAPDIAAYADRVAGFLDDRGLPADATVVGNGLGACVALALAARHGEGFGRLLLTGGAAAFPAEGRKAFASMAQRVRDGGMETVVDTALHRIYTPDHVAAHPDEAAQRRAVLLRMDPDTFVTGCAVLQTMDLREALPRVGNPTLVVVGDQDRATPPALARELADGIPGADLAVLPGCAHAPQLQQPREYLATIAEFLGLSGVAAG